MLERDKTLVVIIDVQEKLLPAIQDAAAVEDNVSRLVRGAAVLDVPVVFTEQNPAGLGPTVATVAADLTGAPVTKMAFSCCGEPAFIEAVRATGRKQILLAGIETHVCVYQTARDLLAGGYDVSIAADAVGSRTAANRSVGLERMQQLGAQIVSVEMALFELLKVAEGGTFKAMLKIVK